MSAVLAFLKANWQYVSLVSLIVTAFLGVKLTVKEGPVSQPEIIVILPEESPMFPQDAGAGKFHRSYRPLIRVHLARAVAARDNIGFGEAWKKTAKLTAEDYDGATIQAAAQLQVPVEKLGDGTLLQNLLDWLKSEQGQAFLKLLLTLLMSFI